MSKSETWMDKLLAQSEMFPKTHPTLGICEHLQLFSRILSVVVDLSSTNDRSKKKNVVYNPNLIHHMIFVLGRQEKYSSKSEEWFNWRNYLYKPFKAKSIT